MSRPRWKMPLCALCACALAVSAAAARGADPAGPAASAGGEAQADLISLNVRDAEIHEVLSTFSKRFNIPIVVGPEIKGRVTVMIANVPWETALGQVLDACDLSYIEEGDIIRVVNKSGTATAPLQAAQAQPAEGRASTAAARLAPPPAASPLAALAEAPAGPSPAPGPAAATPGVGVKSTAKTGVPTVGKVTFDFKEADLVNILRIFSMRYGINIIAGPEVQGKVSIRLVDVPWETALKLILESNNYSYVKQQNVFRILSREQLEKEPMDTKVFPLSYAQAKDVANSISHLLTPQRGLLKPDDRSNTLVITDIPKKLNDIEEVIYRLDRRTPQVLIEARILELSDDFDENIGINWVALKGYNVQIGPPANEGLFSFKREEVHGRGTSEGDVFSDIIAEQDTRTRGRTFGDSTTSTVSTVPGSASGTTITTTDSAKRENLNTVARDRMFGTKGVEGLSADQIPASLPYPSDYTTDQRAKRVMTTELTQAVLTPDNFQLTLNFLQEQTDANLISHPKIVTADNKDSTMKVVEQWPIPRFQFNNDTGQWEISDFQYKDIGIILKVKPHVNEDDFINMRVVPEVSNILTTTTFGGATSANLPIISTRTAETDVLIRNGQTLAIGGLMQENESDAVTKLPLLGEIPLMGPYLFSNSAKKIVNHNIIIFVTANVVTEENKDSLWVGQREQQNKQLNIPKTKWWEPRRLRHGLGSQPGY
mgnify:FL=1